MADETEDEVKDTKPANTGEEEIGSNDVLADARGYLTLVINADVSRADRLEDLRFLSGEDHWAPEVRKERELDKRPCLTINKLPTFLHQVTNDQRQNVPSIKVSPVANTDVKTAEVVQGMIRHMEYSSNADTAYDTAVNTAAACGVGYFRLVTRYCSYDSFDQEIVFKRLRNSFTVYFDPTAQEADGSDQRRCMLSEKMLLSDFKSEYPDAQVPSAGFQAGVGDGSIKEWAGADWVRVAEFYRFEDTPAILIQYSDGSKGFEGESQPPPGVTEVQRRKTMKPKLMWYKLTCIEVLESAEVKCKWIPVFPVYGDELDLDGRIIYSGVIRHAKDPSQMYNYWMTSATEEVALRPKVPYIGASGQFEGFEDDWNSANTRNYSYLEYNPVTVDDKLAPPPQRQPMADIPSGMMQMALMANDNIKATTGLFDSSLGARGSATSGVQEREQQKQGDLANSHFSDNLLRAIRHAGRCIINMIPNYYDAQRVVKIMGEDGKVSSAEINKPEQMAPGQQPQAGGQLSMFQEAVMKVVNDVTTGEYDVVVKSGPSYSTLREEAADAMIEFGKAWPKLMDVAGDKIVRTMDWPGAQEIADRIEKTMPPELISSEKEDGEQNMIETSQGPVPIDKVPAMLAQMEQQMQQMNAALQEAASGMDKAKLEAEVKMQLAQLAEQTAQMKAELEIRKVETQAQTQLEVARINAMSANDIAELQGMVKLLVERMQPPPALTEAAMTKGDGQQV